MRGWVEGSGRDLVDVAAELADAGVAALVVTEIGRDGTLAVPDLDQLAAVLRATADRRRRQRRRRHHRPTSHALADLEIDDRRLAGAIVGRALYEGTFTLAEALEVTARW